MSNTKQQQLENYSKDYTYESQSKKFIDQNVESQHIPTPKRVWMKVDITIQVKLKRSFKFCLRCRQGFLTTLRLVCECSHRSF